MAVKDTISSIYVWSSECSCLAVGDANLREGEAAVLDVECRGWQLRSCILNAKEAASGRDVRPGLARLTADHSRTSSTTARILARAVEGQ